MLGKTQVHYLEYLEAFLNGALMPNLYSALALTWDVITIRKGPLQKGCTRFNSCIILFFVWTAFECIVQRFSLVCFSGCVLTLMLHTGQRTLSIRACTNVLANAAGFPVGREGPMVTIGSNLAFLFCLLVAGSIWDKNFLLRLSGTYWIGPRKAACFSYSWHNVSYNFFLLMILYIGLCVSLVELVYWCLSLVCVLVLGLLQAFIRVFTTIFDHIC